jgi:endonuclease G, mitochondrial
VSLLLDGNGRRELREILLTAFTRSKLERALAEASPVRELTHLVARGPFEDEVAELVDVAERGGWLPQFERVLADELPERKDLQERLAGVLRAAADNTKDLDDEDPPTVAVRGRLLTVAGIGLALATVVCVFSALIYGSDPQAGPWPVILGVTGCAFVVASAALLVAALAKERVGDRLSAFARSKLPVAWLVGLVALAGASAALYSQGGNGGRPNFILQVVDQNGAEQTAVAEQPVQLHELVGPGEEESRIERVTNINGEAFFTLRLGSGTLYSGGILIKAGEAWRDCVFPAFPALEARSVVQNVAALNCREGRGGERDLPREDAVLRISSERASSRPLAAEERARLPSDAARRAERAPLGVPDAPVIIDRRYYSVGYDPSRRAPSWTAFTVGREGSGSAARDQSARFVPDPDLPSELQSQDSDYRDNPYDRGHLVSPADARAMGGDAEREVYYYTAVVPQAEATNRGIWNGLEQYTRELAARAGPLHVLSGPIYSTSQTLVIGPGETPVPVALYRILLRRDSAGSWRALAFAVLNDGSVGRFVPESFVVPISDLETRTGLVFFADLAAGEAARLKTNVDTAGFSQ